MMTVEMGPLEAQELHEHLMEVDPSYREGSEADQKSYRDYLLAQASSPEEQDRMLQGISEVAPQTKDIDLGGPHKARLDVTQDPEGNVKAVHTEDQLPVVDWRRKPTLKEQPWEHLPPAREDWHVTQVDPEGNIKTEVREPAVLPIAPQRVMPAIGDAALPPPAQVMPRIPQDFGDPSLPSRRRDDFDPSLPSQRTIMPRIPVAQTASAPEAAPAVVPETALPVQSPLGSAMRLVAFTEQSKEEGKPFGSAMFPKAATTEEAKAESKAPAPVEPSRAKEAEDEAAVLQSKLDRTSKAIEKQFAGMIDPRVVPQVAEQSLGDDSGELETLVQGLTPHARAVLKTLIKNGILKPDAALEMLRRRARGGF